MSKSISKCLKAISLSAMSIGMLFSNAHAEGPMQAGTNDCTALWYD